MTDDQKARQIVEAFKPFVSLRDAITKARGRQEPPSVPVQFDGPLDGFDTRPEDAKRLLEIAEELEEIARGYLEKGALLHHEAARTRAAAVALSTGNGAKS